MHIHVAFQNSHNNEHFAISHTRNNGFRLYMGFIVQSQFKHTSALFGNHLRQRATHYTVHEC
jgi:hypothetical protein